MNPYGAPETDVHTLAAKLAAGEDFILLDVREPHELDRAALAFPQVIVTPMSQMAQRGLDALPEAARDPAAEIVVMCHHGNRSGQVTMWLIQNGWTNVLNLGGGIDAYAREIDQTVGLY
jgi:rhodanese-related sulfurtransferase